jgi:hypothetical protein
MKTLLGGLLMLAYAACLGCFRHFSGSRAEGAARSLRAGQGTMTRCEVIAAKPGRAGPLHLCGNPGPWRLREDRRADRQSQVA